MTYEQAMIWIDAMNQIADFPIANYDFQCRWVYFPFFTEYGLAHLVWDCEKKEYARIEHGPMNFKTGAREYRIDLTENE